MLSSAYTAPSIMKESSVVKVTPILIYGTIVLFQKGTVNWENQPIISIVGSRKITSYGLSQCEKIIEILAAFNPIIVSGLAYGTDIRAHQSALNHQLQTVAYMAQGLQNTYPKQHPNTDI